MATSAPAVRSPWPTAHELRSHAWIGALIFALCWLASFALSLGGVPAVNNTASQPSAASAQAAAQAALYSAKVGGPLALDPLAPVKKIEAGKFAALRGAALAHPRLRLMTDLTKNPSSNSMQILTNAIHEGSYTAVHRHLDYSEAFIVLSGALAAFTFSHDGRPTCHILTPDENGSGSPALIIEANTYHGMTAAPKALGYPGSAIVLEVSGHTYSPSRVSRALATFVPSTDNGRNGDPAYYKEKLLPLCPPAQATRPAQRPH